MSIFKSIKEWLFPPLHDPYGEYVKKKVENCNKDFKNGFEFPKDKLPYVQKCLKDAGYKVVIKDEVDDKKFPSKRTINRLLGRRDNIAIANFNKPVKIDYNETGAPDDSYKELLYKFDPEDVDTPNMVITRGSVEARDKVAKAKKDLILPSKFKEPIYLKNDLKLEPPFSEFAHVTYGPDCSVKNSSNIDNIPEPKTIEFSKDAIKSIQREAVKSYDAVLKDNHKLKEVNGWVEGNKVVKNAESLYVFKSAQGYTTDEFINRDKKSIQEETVKSYDAVLKDNHKLKMENIDLKNEVDYYEKYIKFIEENYILVLKSPSFLKETFDEMVGDKNE